MKILAIILMLFSALWCVKNYIKGIENQLTYFKDWEKIFRAWSDWIERFSISVDELIEQTISNSLTNQLNVTKNFEGKSIEEVIKDVRLRKDVSPVDNEIILEILQNIGNSMIQKELECLTYATKKLQEIIITREDILKERKELLYKITPLLCGGIAVVLW